MATCRWAVLQANTKEVLENKLRDLGVETQDAVGVGRRLRRRVLAHVWSNTVLGRLCRHTMHAER